MQRTLVALALALAVVVASPAAAAPRCGTNARLLEPGRRRPPEVALAGSKMIRDPFPAAHELRTSANFALRWQAAALDDAQAQMVLGAAESAWSLYVGELGHRTPIGSDAFLLDIYVSTATDTPAIDYGGGYATLDGEGYPYFVVSADLLASPTSLRHVVTHELYHCFQTSRDAFRVDGSFWYWEATAEWAAQERAPEEPDSYAFTGALGLSTHVPMFYMGDPSGAEDPVTGIHQYAASLFPRYLTDTRRDRSLVPATWETAGPNDDALDALLGRVAQDPERAADLFGEFSAHAAVWDLPHAAAIAPSVEVFAASYPERARPAATVGPGGTGGFVEVEADRRLHAYSFDVIELARPAAGDLHVELAVDAAGSAGTPVRPRATLVRAGWRYTPVPVADGVGRVSAKLDHDESRAWLVVAAVASTRDVAETFPFQFRVGPEVGDDSLHAGCRAGGRAPGVWLVLLVLGAGRRRRGSLGTGSKTIRATGSWMTRRETGTTRCAWQACRVPAPHWAMPAMPCASTGWRSTPACRTTARS
jgi:hypothetical protein